jgi:hypothetical protein
MEKQIRNKIIFSASLIITAILLVSIIPTMFHEMTMEGKRDKFISLKGEIQGDLMPEGKYRCCLETPCSSCIALTPWHGEGPECDCLSDIVNGLSPCGECIGGILAGRGNPYLAEYFAKAIEEETGEEDTIKKIIEEKYGIPVSDQL